MRRSTFQFAPAPAQPIPREEEKPERPYPSVRRTGTLSPTSVSLRMRFVVALALPAFVALAAGRAYAQAPTIDSGLPTSLPGSGGSLLGPAPGAGGSLLGPAPGAGGGTLGANQGAGETILGGRPG